MTNGWWGTSPRPLPLRERMAAARSATRGYRLAGVGMTEIDKAPLDAKVNHPSHYNGIPGIECIDVVEHFDFCTGNAIKYLWRAGLKVSESRLADLRKAAWYLNRIIEREEADD